MDELKCGNVLILLSTCDCHMYFFTQLKLYARYTNFVNIEQDQSDRSYAVCKKDDNEVDDQLITNDRIIFFLAFAVLLPMIFVVISAICEM